MHSNIRIFNYILLTGSFLLLSCVDDPALADKEINFQNRQWYRSDPVIIKFRIDHTEKININAFITTDPEVYRFSNLYIKFILKNASGKILRSELKEFFLSDPQSGNLFGETAGDFCKTTCPMTENFNFEPGTYTAEVLHYMREDPLKGIVSAEIVVSDSSNP